MSGGDAGRSRRVAAADTERERERERERWRDGDAAAVVRSLLGLALHDGGFARDERRHGNMMYRAVRQRHTLVMSISTYYKRPAATSSVCAR